MEIVKSKWEDSDKPLFLSFLKTFQQIEKEVWSRKILNTKLELLSIPTKTIYYIVNEIFKGDFLSFLDLEIFDNYESIAIYGKLLCKIEVFEEMMFYLNKYLLVMENWAHVDLLSFDINDKNKEQFLSLSKEYLKDSKTFVRRLGLMILFQIIKDESVLPIIYQSLKELEQENEYYVIMMAGWLLSECIIKYREQTLRYIDDNPHINKKIVNKGIQKCRESRRLTQIEKDELLPYKRR